LLLMTPNPCMKRRFDESLSAANKAFYSFVFFYLRVG
jgi:hypothetical protein